MIPIEKTALMEMWRADLALTDYGRVNLPLSSYQNLRQLETKHNESWMMMGRVINRLWGRKLFRTYHELAAIWRVSPGTIGKASRTARNAK